MMYHIAKLSLFLSPLVHFQCSNDKDVTNEPTNNDDNDDATSGAPEDASGSEDGPKDNDEKEPIKPSPIKPVTGTCKYKLIPDGDLIDATKIKNGFTIAPKCPESYEKNPDTFVSKKHCNGSYVACQKVEVVLPPPQDEDVCWIKDTADADPVQLEKNDSDVFEVDADRCSSLKAAEGQKYKLNEFDPDTDCKGEKDENHFVACQQVPMDLCKKSNGEWPIDKKHMFNGPRGKQTQVAHNAKIKLVCKDNKTLLENECNDGTLHLDPDHEKETYLTCLKAALMEHTEHGREFIVQQLITDPKLNHDELVESPDGAVNLLQAAVKSGSFTMVQYLSNFLKDKKKWNEYMFGNKQENIFPVLHIIVAKAVEIAQQKSDAGEELQEVDYEHQVDIAQLLLESSTTLTKEQQKALLIQHVVGESNTPNVLIKAIKYKLYGMIRLLMNHATSQMLPLQDCFGQFNLAKAAAEGDADLESFLEALKEQNETCKKTAQGKFQFRHPFLYDNDMSVDFEFNSIENAETTTVKQLTCSDGTKKEADKEFICDNALLDFPPKSLRMLAASNLSDQATTLAIEENPCLKPVFEHGVVQGDKDLVTKMLQLGEAAISVFQVQKTGSPKMSLLKYAIKESLRIGENSTGKFFVIAMNMINKFAKENSLTDEIHLAIESGNTDMIDLIVDTQQPNKNDLVQKHETVQSVQKRYLETQVLAKDSPLQFAKTQVRLHPNGKKQEKILNYIEAKVALKECPTADPKFRDDLEDGTKRFLFTTNGPVQHGQEETMYCIKTDATLKLVHMICDDGQFRKASAVNYDGCPEDETSLNKLEALKAENSEDKIKALYNYCFVKETNKNEAAAKVYNPDGNASQNKLTVTCKENYQGGGSELKADCTVEGGELTVNCTA